MKLKMIALITSFAVVAGFGTGGASTSLSQLNPRICSAKNLCRNGNGMLTSSTGMETAKIPADANVEQSVSGAIVPLCPPTTQCVPDITRPANVDVEQRVSKAIVPLCPSGTQCGPDITRPASVDVEQEVSKAIVPLCPSGTQCVPEIMQPTSEKVAIR